MMDALALLAYCGMATVALGNVLAGCAIHCSKGSYREASCSAQIELELQLVLCAVCLFMMDALALLAYRGMATVALRNVLAGCVRHCSKGSYREAIFSAQIELGLHFCVLSACL